ncbi:MAG: hypothetical protein JJT96_18265 [Opitutales bacterium]|nr:hypothetical protein [Opitutales bacterium]
MKKTTFTLLTLAGSALLALSAAAQERPLPERPGPVLDRPVVERPIERPIAPQEIHDKRADLATIRAELAQSRAELMRSLGEDATREEHAIALREWYAENAEAMAYARELAAELAAWRRENRPQRPEAPGGREGVAERRADFRERAQAMAAERQALREQMRDATAEEREELIRDFRETQSQLMQERREQRRSERAPGGPVGGERRPGG